jgi:hypothetical protein
VQPFGRGLQLLMIRDLMLVPNISVHGAEDTPMAYYETARKVAEGDSRSIYVMGNTTSGPTGFRLELRVHTPGRGWVKGTASSDQFGEFLYKSAAMIAKAVGGQVDQMVVERWRLARPSFPESLARFGSIQVAMAQSLADQLKEFVKLSREDPSFALPLSSIDSDLPDSLPHFMEAYRRDPFDAQLCFVLFTKVWQSRGWQREAMQFLRRAIEISPGHGKAHMCAPHAAHPDARMLRHAELGYRLLPGNSFAVSNYLKNMDRYGARPEQRIALAREGIANDPSDPSNYYQLIKIYCEQSKGREALAVAEELQTLFEPEINERTLYCLKQNPRRAQLIESGQYNPADENRRLIAKLREKIESPI